MSGPHLELLLSGSFVEVLGHITVGLIIEWHKNRSVSNLAPIPWLRGSFCRGRAYNLDIHLSDETTRCS